MLHSARPSTGQTKIERVDAQRLHQMKNLDFLGNRRIAHRWRLQPIAQTLIIQQHRTCRLQSRRMILVPVVDEIGSVHGRVPSTEYLGTKSTRASFWLGTRYSVLATTSPSAARSAQTLQSFP